MSCHFFTSPPSPHLPFQLPFPVRDSSQISPSQYISLPYLPFIHHIESLPFPRPLSCIPLPPFHIITPVSPPPTPCMCSSCVIDVFSWMAGCRFCTPVLPCSPLVFFFTLSHLYNHLPSPLLRSIILSYTNRIFSKPRHPSITSTGVLHV